MSKKLKIAILIVLLSALLGLAYFFARNPQRPLSFESHNPLKQGLSDKDFQELYAIHRDCFEEAKRKNLTLYFMKYEHMEKIFAAIKADQVISDSKRESEKSFANHINAFVAREGGEILGLYNCREEEQATHGSMMVFNVCVRKEKRGQGYGAQLMAHAVQQCARPGKAITLTVYKDDTKVVEFYKKLDFKIIANTK